MTTMDAAGIIATLGLARHPEGGHYRETYREEAPDGGRGAQTAIYYLLCQNEVSAWHRVDAGEIWHWYAGAPLALSLVTAAGRPSALLLGPDLANGQRPQAAVPPFAWQSARSTGAWSLVGCTVAPAFRFEGFELAPAGFTPTTEGQTHQTRLWERLSTDDHTPG